MRVVGFQLSEEETSALYTSETLHLWSQVSMTTRARGARGIICGVRCL